MALPIFDFTFIFIFPDFSMSKNIKFTPIGDKYLNKDWRQLKKPCLQPNFLY